MVPFRSVTKSLFLSWSDVHVRFSDVNDLVNRDEEENKSLLPAACRLQPTDGNLEQDLCLLEDQVDNLLQDNDEDSDNNQEIGTSSSNTFR